MKAKGSRYRADIDGLRALSVVLVIINHANESWLPSGFIGVDVFFVISGFVVTSSLLSGDHGAGWGGIGEFWRRRILRILPALIVFALLTTMFFASFFALTTNVQFESAIRTGIASLIGVSNLYLSYISTDYFLLDQSINPFLHTWSLGVEEQFYFVFAVLFFSVMGLFRSGERTLLAVVLLLCFVSFWQFHWGMTEQPILTYYGLHSRFWELGAGVILAVWGAQVSRTKPQMRQLTSEVLGFSGIVLIVSAALFFEGGEDGAKYSITAAVLGASMFISSGFFATNRMSALMSIKPLVFIGVLSYSIYLYHWPVLIFVKNNLHGNAVDYFLSLVVIFGLSFLSYRLVETPFRRMRLPLLKRVLPIFASIIFSSAAVLQISGSTQGRFYAGAPINYQDWLLPSSQPYSAMGSIRTVDCLLTNGAKIPNRIPDSCFTRTTANWEGRTVFLIGDSHAFSNFAMIAGLENEQGLRGAALVHDGCNVHKVYEKDSSCGRYKSSLVELLGSSLRAGDFIFIAAFFPLDDEIDQTQLKIFLDPIAELAQRRQAKLVIELPHLRAEKTAIACTREWFRRNYQGCDMSFTDAQANRADAVVAIKGAISEQHASILFWDPLPHLCYHMLCKVVSGPMPILRDQNHLSVAASASLTPHFVEFLLGAQ